MLPPDVLFPDMLGCAGRLPVSALVRVLRLLRGRTRPAKRDQFVGHPPLPAPAVGRYRVPGSQLTRGWILDHGMTVSRLTHTSHVVRWYL